ncbi:MAG: mechanosensitive ion channel family protein [Planctomycetota bacterium]
MCLRNRIAVDRSSRAHPSSHSYRVFALLICLCASAGTAYAQQDLQLTAADTSSPRDTLRSFIDSCNAVAEIIEQQRFLDPEDPQHAALGYRIIDCLDISDLPAFSRKEHAGEVAVCLKEILDRVELPPWDQIPGVDEIQAAGGYEQFSRWRIPYTRITIVRMEAGPQKHEYLFSAGTVERAIDYFESVRSKPYRTDLPQVSAGLHKWYLSAPRSPFLADIVGGMPNWMQYGRTLGMTRWKWPFFLAALAIAIALMTSLYWRYSSVTQDVSNLGLIRYWLTLGLPIAAACVPVGFLNVIQKQLGVRGTPLYATEFLSILACLSAIIVVVFATTARVSETIIASPSINPQGLNAQLIRIVAKLIALAIIVGLVLSGGQYLGFDVGTLLASAGIGGVALALGAQDTLKDLFGTISLMADKPFRVGERIILGDYDGVVEDIGLRSTRLRLLSGHLVTLPNDQLARSDVENVGRRPHIRRIADIQLPLDTPLASLERALVLIREALAEHEGMDPEFPPRAFFTDYLPSGFNVRVIYWYHPPNYWDFLEVGEKVNLAIFRAFDAQGIRFSLPSPIAHASIDGTPAPIAVKVVSDA